MNRTKMLGALAVVAGLVIIGGLLMYRTTPSEPTATFGGVSLRIELATTTAAQERGLGGRESVPEGYGMLFVFPKDNYYGVWMKGMRTSIDIFWLDANGQTVSVQESVEPSSYPRVFYPTVPARYVLETAAGFAQAHNVTIGAPLQLKNLPEVSQ